MVGLTTRPPATSRISFIHVHSTITWKEHAKSYLTIHLCPLPSFLHSPIPLPTLPLPCLPSLPPSLPSLSPVVYSLLRAVVLEPEQGAPHIHLLASAVLRELAPSSSIVVRDFNPRWSRPIFPASYLSSLCRRTPGRCSARRHRLPSGQSKFMSIYCQYLSSTIKQASILYNIMFVYSGG